MDKLLGYVSIESIVTNGVYNCDGCAEYAFYNAGNVNVSIDGILVLRPGASWEGPTMHPNVAYFSKHKVEFDEANAPTDLAPVGGVLPPPFVLAPGDPAPAKDRRVLIFKTFVK